MLNWQRCLKSTSPVKFKQLLKLSPLSLSIIAPFRRLLLLIKEQRSKESRMLETSMNIPELSLIASTRVMIGSGLALLLADRMTPEQRKAAGWALFIAGMTGSSSFYTK